MAITLPRGPIASNEGARVSQRGMSISRPGPVSFAGVKGYCRNENNYISDARVQ